MMRNLRIFQRVSSKFSVICLPNRLLFFHANKLSPLQRQADSLTKCYFHCSTNLRNDSRVPISKSTENVEQPKPAYHITFTCTVCNHRSGHKMSKQAYHNGTVFVQCPHCKNRHLMADHLKIFSDKRITIEDILSNKGEILRKGFGQIVDGNVVEIEPDNLRIKADFKAPSSDKSASTKNN
ncbi:TIM23 translocase complex subunit Tim15 [Schizosaccharomyces octosporus yFS286]|uniref:TIM23 translocase complex subunit Tim15 n=1 Tax=Schizosaccharomyces octosporus (strain yFS286) TaxID=483514 RepID=S9Q130_SCHOY|nr:TIM23 translocase complex subunit Tim15 [Schizosaccharomyces octosporus yFS286]EPX74981.1 TIM23 translocase complex subunit Tim15 [Schizosaccharomyces octosporus yFS286]